MASKKSDRDYGWAVVAPLGAIEKMIGEKHLYNDFIPYRILNIFLAQPFEVWLKVQVVLLKKLSVWKKKKSMKRWLWFIPAQPELMLAANPIG